MLHRTLLLPFLIWQCRLIQALSAEEEGDEEYVRVIVGFHDRKEEQEYVQTQQRRMLRAANGKPKTKINYEFQSTEAVAMEVTRDELEQMKKDNKFLYIEDDIMVPVAKNEDDYDGFEFRNYGIGLTQADSGINPDPSYGIGCGVYACVVDSGVYIDNADIPYAMGDGYVEGKSFYKAAERGEQWYNPRGTDHGTQVAGVMIARGGNARGTVGVIPQGPQGSRVCLRVAKVVPDGEGAASVSSLLEASEWCAQQAAGKPLVINLSFAVDIQLSVEKWIYQSLYNRGVLLVAAAGNMGDSRLSYPAAHDSVISVASVNEKLRRSYFSQYNSQVELAAPGEGIEVLQAESNEIRIADGTSLASPVVAGLAARIWSAFPYCTNQDIRLALRSTAYRLGDGVPNQEYGYGLIRARDAYDFLLKMDCAPSTSPPTPPPTLPPPTLPPTPTPTPPPALPPTSTPISLPTPPPTLPPTSTPISLPTPPPTRTPDQSSLNCVQNVFGGELSIPNNSFFRRDEVHCLRLNGQQAYFGYISPNQFGLFVNGQVLWKAPVTSVTAAGWIFQRDGNMLMKDINNQGIWRTQTGGNWNSIMRVSFQRVWIESSTGSTLWSQPPNVGSPTPPLVAPTPTPPPTIRPLNCVQTVNGTRLFIPKDTFFRKGDLHCVNDGNNQVYFGYTLSNKFGLFVNDQGVWTAPESVVASLDRWSFQGDGNLVLRDGSGNPLWATGSDGNFNSKLRVSSDGVWIERNTGSVVWARPPYLQPPKQPTNNDNVNTNGGLQYYAYYYPWYLRNDWSRHVYQDEPLLGKYGTNEVGVAEQHIQWALEAGISSWVLSWWGTNHLAMNHFRAGMMNAPSINKMKFCMMYESVILDDRGNWRDGSKEEYLFQDLRAIRDEFFNHPSYLRINGRPVIIFYITRARMKSQDGFDGPAVLENLRRRLGHNIYFIADEPFFGSKNNSADQNENALKNGQQVFDAYTTYNMFVNDNVRDGESATDYNLREPMPIWRRWAERVTLFPNVMPRYYDFRGNKPLVGNAETFMRQLREVACLPRTNFNGAPQVMFITSFNNWWEGTQIEPENGSPDNLSNYGFQFIETLAAFKKELDSRGSYWC